MSRDNFLRMIRDELKELYYIIKQRGYWALIGLTILCLLGWAGAQFAGLLVISHPWLLFLPWIIVALPLWGIFAVRIYLELKERRDFRKAQEETR